MMSIFGLEHGEDYDPNIDPWKIEKFDPAWNPTGMLEVSSFSRLFPRNREKYLEESWPTIESALKEHGVTCKLDLVNRCMSVSTTKETSDPYMIVKARDLIRLLARRVPAPQAIKILEDDMQYDIINIRNLVAEEKFVKRRQRLVGPNSSSLKELAVFTNCYILVQGSTVAAMGPYKGVRQVRSVVVDCVQENSNPLHTIKCLDFVEIMKKDPGAIENSVEFLPFLKEEKQTNLEKVKKPLMLPCRSKNIKFKKPLLPCRPVVPMWTSEAYGAATRKALELSYQESAEEERRRRRQKFLKQQKEMRENGYEFIAVASPDLV